MKKDTRFHPCRYRCGRTEWGTRPRTCDECKAALAATAAANRRARQPATQPRLGVAYTRGRAMSEHLGRGV